MKVTVNPTTGELSFDVDTVDQALELAQRYGGGGTGVPPAETNDPPTPRGDADLTDAQYEAWSYLVEHEGAPRGVTLASVARRLKIDHNAAGARLSKLVQLGYAERVSVGRYRALCSADEKSTETEA